MIVHKIHIAVLVANQKIKFFVILFGSKFT